MSRTNVPNLNHDPCFASHRRHNGAALSLITACIKALPNANSIAYFDSAFHRSIPPHIVSYAIDQKVAKEKGLKKYGFHGLSCECQVESLASKPNSPSAFRRVHFAFCCCVSPEGNLETRQVFLVLTLKIGSPQVLLTSSSCTLDRAHLSAQSKEGNH